MIEDQGLGIRDSEALGHPRKRLGGLRVAGFQRQRLAILLGGGLQVSTRLRNHAQREVRAGGLVLVAQQECSQQRSVEPQDRPIVAD